MWPRWLRTFATIWVAWDSKKRSSVDIFWVILVFLLGPFMLPFYIVARPLLKGESRSKCYFLNIFFAFESLFSWLFALAGTLVAVENLTTSDSKDIAEVKVAEIKAGTIVGVVFALLLLGLEKIALAHIKKSLENRN